MEFPFHMFVDPGYNVWKTKKHYQADYRSEEASRQLWELLSELASNRKTSKFELQKTPTAIPS